jgi:hypothetical protein
MRYILYSYTKRASLMQRGRAVFEQQMLHAAIGFKEIRDRILYDVRADRRKIF